VTRAAEGGSRRDTGHFSLLQERPVILHASDWEITDPTAALWSVLDALPVARSYLLVSPTWTLEASDSHQHQLSRSIEAVRDRFGHVEVVVLAGSPTELEAWAGTGQPALYCSHNAFVRDDYFFPIVSRVPTFDAIYDGKWADYKRHQLAGSVQSLALIAYPLPESSSEAYSEKALSAVGHATWFTKPWLPDPPYLSHSEVNAAYNTARVGLCLSEREGACFASIQYLLAGLPVVTTINLGGRDEFFNERVARWVDADADAVAGAVAELGSLRLDPAAIRAEALKRVGEHRQRLLEWIRGVVDEAHSRRPSRWHAGWPPGLPNKLIEPQASANEVIGAIGP
jgi:glycosyltransferase involved in cell wall biosynthesis